MSPENMGINSQVNRSSSIVPVHSVSPSTDYQSPYTAPVTRIDNNYVRKFTRVCAPVCVILSICLAIFFFNAIETSLLIKGATDSDHTNSAQSYETFQRWQQIIKALLIATIVLGVVTFISFVVALCKELDCLLYEYTFYHIISNFIILLGTIAKIYSIHMFEKIMFGQGFHMSMIAYSVFFLAFFFFTNYTNWQVLKLKKILKSYPITVMISYNSAGGGHPFMYSQPHDLNSAPPAYPGPPAVPIPSEAPPKYGHWTTVSSLA
uniref:Uncharacterized protein n=1 Tax=Plectus sambesii TaxID=2011161 RepID=A0A914XDB8_9BILA